MQNRKVYEMEAIAIIEGVLKDRSSYEKTVYLLKCYKDLKLGREINENDRSVLHLIDRAIDLIADDEYIDIIKYMYVKGYTYEKTAEAIGMDKRTLYRQRRRLIKRIAIIIYGDKAL
jgi:hypothetical protein